MDGYTITAAAALLGTTRQTIYTRIKKDPGQYAILTDDGKQLITLQGLALLKETLKHRPGPTVKSDELDKTGTGQNHAALRAELSRQIDLNTIQAQELLRLSNTVASLSRQVETLQADKTFLQAALDKALDKRSGSWWQRLLGK